MVITTTGIELYAYVLVGIFIAVIKHYEQKQVGEERLYFILWLIFCHLGKSGHKLKVETWG